jgi:hypothetical protein
MPTWPASLPSLPLADGYREITSHSIVRTEMEQGPAKLRRRSTAAVSKLTLSYLLSTADIQALEEFIQDDLMGGALAFSFDHPRTGSAVSCRFRQLPEYGAVNGGYFKVSVELEVLP